MHCDLLPVEDDHGKIKKLVKYFQEKNWVRLLTLSNIIYFHSFHVYIATYTHKVNSIQYWIQLCQLTLSYF